MYPQLYKVDGVHLPSYVTLYKEKLYLKKLEVGERVSLYGEFGLCELDKIRERAYGKTLRPKD